MDEKTCANCRHNVQYDQWLTEIRMCDAISSKPSERHESSFMFVYGECKGGKLWESKT